MIWQTWRDGAGRLWAKVRSFQLELPFKAETDTVLIPGQAKRDRAANRLLRHKVEIAGRSGVYSVKRRDWKKGRDHIPRPIVALTEPEPGILTKAMLWEESHK